MAVAISRKPEARPRDLSRAVEAAVAAATRAPEPEPEPAPKGNGKDEAHEADDEPELASASPRIPSNASVAKQATFKNAINLGKTNLIGVYGTNSKRYAMIRTENGRYKKVKVGDKIDGGKIQAITANEVRYQKGSRLVTLAMPKG
jgi:type IV pilus biogenesis protein PilP